MSVLLIGLNHRTAPVGVREQMAFGVEGAATALLLLHNRWPGTEAAIISTCNRLELLLASDQPHPSPGDLVRFLAEARDLPASRFRDCLYTYRDRDAVGHLFRVAGGLDSMVLGEYQIVNQLKQAYATASEQGTIGPVLHHLLHQAFHVSGRIRTETQIGRRRVSIPSVAVDLARDIFRDFSDKKTLVIGAGEMAQLVCQHLENLDARRFTVTSRTLHNARTLAHACRGRAIPYHRLDDAFADADIIITATRCPRPIITAQRWRPASARRGGRPVYIIDLAVPRNVEPALGRLPGVYLQDIDRLGALAASNADARARELVPCEAVVDQEIDAFDRWLQESRSAPLIAQMYQDARTLRDLELDRLEHTCGDLSPAQRAAVAQLADRLINKFMHPCAQTLKQHAASEPTATLAGCLRELTARQAEPPPAHPPERARSGVMNN